MPISIAKLGTIFATNALTMNPISMDADSFVDVQQSISWKPIVVVIMKMAALESGFPQSRQSPIDLDMNQGR